MIDRRSDLARIRDALAAAAVVFERFPQGPVKASTKGNQDPVTEADLEVDRVLREALVEADEGWLSEETADDPRRLESDRVWVVDPLDGTKEFVLGLPEWCVSVGLVEQGRAVAGGIMNPWIGFIALGAEGHGCTLNGVSAQPTMTAALDASTVLASRTEVDRGQWESWGSAKFRVEAMGSVAFKLARVAVGLADATWTLVPKHEWDVAAGVALVEAAGGWAATLEGERPVFNRTHPKLTGLIASGRNLEQALRTSVLAATYSPRSA
jgi:myo-inositol-1(or 4)-monophosphatase